MNIRIEKEELDANEVSLIEGTFEQNLYRLSYSKNDGLSISCIGIEVRTYDVSLKDLWEALRFRCVIEMCVTYPEEVSEIVYRPCKYSRPVPNQQSA